MTETPELDRQSELFKDGTIPAVQEFQEWLADQGISLMRWDEIYEDQDCVKCSGLGHKLKKNESEWAGWSVDQPAEFKVPCKKCDETGKTRVKISEGWVPETRTREQLLADYLGLDLDQIEQERRAILDAQRKINDRT